MNEMVFGITQLNIEDGINKDDKNVRVFEGNFKQHCFAWKSFLTIGRNVDKSININPETIDELIDNLNKIDTVTKENGLIRYSGVYFRVSTDEDIKLAKEQGFYTKFDWEL